MSQVIDRLRRLGPAGLPFEDARRLLLTLWMTLDVLPPEARSEVLDRGNLARIFTTLAEEGVVSAEGAEAEHRKSFEYWLTLPEAVLRGTEAPMDFWFERARRYLRR